jgi:hypothetical protein
MLWRPATEIRMKIRLPSESLSIFLVVLRCSGRYVQLVSDVSQNVQAQQIRRSRGGTGIIMNISCSFSMGRWDWRDDGVWLLRPVRRRRASSAGI